MSTRERFVVTLTLGFAAGLLTAASAAAGGVSPGDPGRFAVVEVRCPTFSWEVSPGADAFELVAFVLPSGLEPADVADHHLTAETEVLYQRLPGGATGWTPSAERCLAPGGRYAWFVRAVTGGEPSEWSEGRYFAVPLAPSAEELARALAVLQRYADEGGETAEPEGAARGETSRQVSTPRLAKAGGGGGPKSVPTAPAAVRGDSPDTVGELYGVVGTSASISGAGVGAANTAGGPDLVLDGSANGEVDTLISESGLARASADTEVFTVYNSGGGAMVLEVEGTLEATALDCPGCVNATQLASSAVTSAKIATGAVTGAKIADGAVDSGAIRSNAVTSTHITDGAVTSADILDGTITAADVDLAGGLYVSKTQPYQRQESFTWNVANTIAQIIVACDDVNDLPLTGWCSANDSSLETVHHYGDYWDTYSWPAAFTCKILNRFGNNSTGTATIVCLAVP